MDITIDELMKVLTLLNMNFTVNHTEEYSELIIPTNNELIDCNVVFDCKSRKILEIFNQEE